MPRYFVPHIMKFPKSKVDLCGDDSNHANVINKTLIEKRITEPEQVYYWEFPQVMTVIFLFLFFLKTALTVHVHSLEP